MRPSLRLARAVASLGGATALLGYAFLGTSVAEDQVVQANGQNQFTPADVTVNPGDTVTWRYAGGFGHTVTSTSANWNKDDSLGPPTATLQTSHLFDRPGTYTYVCKTHESVGMRGTVTVTGPAATTRPPTPTRTTTRPPTARPTTAPPTAGPTATPSGTPSPSASSAVPPVLPSGSVAPSLTTAPPSPTALPGESVSPSAALYLGEGGLTPAPPSGRDKGLPVMVALLLIGGVGSAEVRALLANAPD